MDARLASPYCPVPELLSSPTELDVAVLSEPTWLIPQIRETPPPELRLPS